MTKENYWFKIGNLMMLGKPMKAKELIEEAIKEAKQEAEQEYLKKAGELTKEKIICEHKGCDDEDVIIICHNHINEDYPLDCKQEVKKAKQDLIDDIEEHYKAKWIDELKKKHKLE